MESIRQIKNNNVDLISNIDPLDKNRLLIEDLWESVLREECPGDQAERLIQLKELSYSKQIDGDSSKTFKNEIVESNNEKEHFFIAVEDLIGNNIHTLFNGMECINYSF